MWLMRCVLWLLAILAREKPFLLAEWCQIGPLCGEFFAFLEALSRCLRFWIGHLLKSRLCTWNGECLKRNLKPGWTCLHTHTHTHPPPPSTQPLSMLRLLVGASLSRVSHLGVVINETAAPYMQQSLFYCFPKWQLLLSLGAPNECFFYFWLRLSHPGPCTHC